MDSDSEIEIIAELKTTVLKSKTLDAETQLELLLQNFQSIYESVTKSNVTTVFRIISCDTLSIWFTRSLQLLSKNPNKKIDLSYLLDEEKANFLFQYVIDFWNDSGAALGNALKELFVKLVSFLTIVIDKTDSSMLFRKWLLIALDLPDTMKAFYFMIEHLHKHVEPRSFILDHKPNFVVNCIENIWSRALGSAVGKCVFMVLRYNYEKGHETSWLGLWKHEVIQCLHKSNLRKGIESYLLPNLFQVSKPATIDFLQKIIEIGDAPILISLLKVAQESGILIEPFLEIDPNTNKPLIDIQKIAELLKVSNSALRIGAFQLLVSSSKLSKRIPSCVYENVMESFDMIFTETDLETRNEMFSYFKRFISRIKDSTYALQRDAESLTKKNYIKFEDEIKEKIFSVEESKNFIKALLEYIESNLIPSSSYVKKEMAYKLLIVLINSGVDSSIDKKYIVKSKSVTFPYSIQVYTESLTRIVIDNIMDNFEDIRNYSTQIITMSPYKLDEIINMELLEARATKMLCDIKGKDVDSGARFFKFAFNYYQSHDNMEKCEQIIKSLLGYIDSSLAEAKNNVSVACIFHSIQGYYAALKFIFEIVNFEKCLNFYESNNAFDRLIFASTEIWEVVKVVLQHDSPEGIVLDEFEANYTTELEAQYGKGSQVILSYAWRSVKESSNMIDTLLTVPNCPLSDEQILKIGSVLLEQLATIRHRGAFSSVYPTFVSCCRLCTMRKSLSETTQIWLDENLELIQTRSKYITRRSAGIPFLITAILSSDKSLVKPTFYKLLDVAKRSVEEEDTVMENVNLPQVNAFNCIKTIFIDSTLSEESIYYVDEAFALTLNSFASPFWAIRNCAVMLFTALQNRLFSSKKIKANYMTSYPARLFFEKFSTIHGLFLDTLNESVSNGLENQTEIEKVFPILTIMGRLEPTPGYRGLDTFIPIIIEILGNRIWKVREMAARSLPSLISSSHHFEKVMDQLLKTIGPWEKNNKMHGSLLAIRETILKFQALSSNETTQSVKKLLNPLDSTRIFIISKLPLVVNHIDCYPIKMVYFQILKLLNINATTTGFEQLLVWFTQNNKLNEKLDGGKQLALKELAELLFEISKKDDLLFIENLIDSSLYEVQLSCIGYYSSNIHLLNQKTKTFLMKKIWEIIEKENVWKYVKSQCLKLLKNLIVESDETELIDTLETQTMKLLELYSVEFNEDIKLSVVETLGSYVSKLMITDESKYEKYYSCWIGYVKSIISDDLDYIIRSAALKSLIAFDKIYKVGGKTDKIKVTIECYLFQFLTDDDENIQRETAQHITKYILILDEIEIVPIVVEKMMVKHFAEYENVDLLELIINHEGIGFYDVDIKLSDIAEVDSLLFAAEKENLERNPIVRIKELIFLIESTNLRHQKRIFSLYNAKLHQNITDVVAYIKDTGSIDGCFGFLSNEMMFDFVSCQILLFNCLKSYDLIDGDIGELKTLLQGNKMYCHPFISKILKG